jgi:hypothetical protein
MSPADSVHRRHCVADEWGDVRLEGGQAAKMLRLIFLSVRRREEALDLIEPLRTGWRQVHAAFGQRCLDQRLVSDDEVDFEFARSGG